MNKNLFSYFILVLSFVVAFNFLGVSSAQAAPRLTIPESSFDFGYVPQNSKITHDFWLYSSGDDSLKILKVVPG